MILAKCGSSVNSLCQTKNEEACTTSSFNIVLFLQLYKTDLFCEGYLFKFFFFPPQIRYWYVTTPFVIDGFTQVQCIIF